MSGRSSRRKRTSHSASSSNSTDTDEDGDDYSHDSTGANGDRGRSNFEEAGHWVCTPAFILILISLGIDIGLVIMGAFESSGAHIMSNFWWFILMVIVVAIALTTWFVTLFAIRDPAKVGSDGTSIYETAHWFAYNTWAVVNFAIIMIHGLNIFLFWNRNGNNLTFSDFNGGTDQFQFSSGNQGMDIVQYADRLAQATRVMSDWRSYHTIFQYIIASSVIGLFMVVILREKKPQFTKEYTSQFTELAPSRRVVTENRPTTLLGAEETAGGFIGTAGAFARESTLHQHNTSAAAGF